MNSQRNDPGQNTLKTPKVCTIVLNWNGKTDTLNCLNSLKNQPGEVIVVDNGSTDDSVDAIRSSHPDCHLIETKANLGYAGGNNVGIAYALEQGYTHLFILNNDTTLDTGCVCSLLATFQKRPELGVLGAWIVRMDEPELLDHLGGTWNPKTCSFDYVGYRKSHSETACPDSLDYVCGAAVMIKREVFEKVGLFDARFFLFWEEADLCFAARNAGFEVGCCKQARIWHRISASFTGGKPHASYFVNRNRLLWIEKNTHGLEMRWLLTKTTCKNLVQSGGTLTIRRAQLLLQKLRGKDTTRNRERIIRAKAVSTATWDYLFRRFYAGRSKNFMNCH